ncbi:uncharacterized protein V6R79_013478 [Siganus canaliculatus]
MRLAVVVAILVVVCVLDNAAAIRSSSSANKSFSCTGYKDVPCGRGWSRFGGWRCANFYSAAKTYDDAEAYCRTQGAHLVSVHDFADMHNTLCLSKRGNPAVQKVWVGAKKVVGMRNASAAEERLDAAREQFCQTRISLRLKRGRGVRRTVCFLARRRGDDTEDPSAEHPWSELITNVTETLPKRTGEDVHKSFQRQTRQGNDTCTRT